MACNSEERCNAVFDLRDFGRHCQSGALLRRRMVAYPPLALTRGGYNLAIHLSDAEDCLEHNATG